MNTIQNNIELISLEFNQYRQIAQRYYHLHLTDAQYKGGKDAICGCGTCIMFRQLEHINEFKSDVVPK